jgi:hypothetical protein
MFGDIEVGADSLSTRMRFKRLRSEAQQSHLVCAAKI